MVVPVMAEELYMNAQPDVQQFQQNGKDECLITALNCGNRAMSIQNRIDAIQNEINKGAAVYTNEELGVLQRRLEDANRELSDAQVGGA